MTTNDHSQVNYSAEAKNVPSPRIGSSAWFGSVKRRLFPERYCYSPATPWPPADVITTRTQVSLSWADRLRILWTGRAMLETRTAIDVEVGKSVTSSAFWVMPNIMVSEPSPNAPSKDGSSADL